MHSLLPVSNDIYRDQLSIGYQKTQRLHVLMTQQLLLYAMLCAIWYHLYNFKNVLKVTLLRGCFSRFLNCTNGTKSRKLLHIIFHNISCIFIRTTCKTYITILLNVENKQTKMLNSEPKNICFHEKVLFFVLCFLQDKQLCINFDADQLNPHAFSFTMIRSYQVYYHATESLTNILPYSQTFSIFLPQLEDSVTQ